MSKYFTYGSRKSQKEQRERKKSAPQSPMQIALSLLIVKAMQLGRIQAQCLKGSLTWAAFYTERVKFNLERVKFEVAAHLVSPTIEEDHESKPSRTTKKPKPKEASLKKSAVSLGTTATVKACPNCGAHTYGHNCPG